MKQLLMIAYHFPPLSGSSGIQRTLRFVRHLPEFGWSAVVLTAHPRAYEGTSDDLMDEIPVGVTVKRAFAFDAARHLTVRGHYPRFLARPDRWMTWQFAAIPAGLRLIRKHRAAAIWSTFPIATAHVIGGALCRRSGLPWIADFRDPMAQPGYPEDPDVWKGFKDVEELTLGDARFSVFTTPGAARDYRNRYPAAAERIAVIENGYDEESFGAASEEVTARASLNPGAVTLLHSGVVYPMERDPTQMFAALARLRTEGRIAEGDLVIRFRAAGSDPFLQELARRYRVEAFIQTLPAIGYRQALLEMQAADGLLVLQAGNCNNQIPAKIYEYFRARRPVLALTDPQGDTAGVVRAAGLDTIARLESIADIATLLREFVDGVRSGTAKRPDAGHVAQASRRDRARQLAELLERATIPHADGVLH